MQALILAAGKGSRLGEITENSVKSMTKVGGASIIERMLRQLDKHNLNRIIIVVGYLEDVFKEYINSLEIKTEIVFVSNELYDTTNNIYSLALAKDYFKEDDTLTLESDLIFEDLILDKFIDDERKDLIMVDKYERWMDGTVITQEDNYVTSMIGKENFNYNKTDEYYKTVNIYKFSKEFINEEYLPALEEHMSVFGHNEYYENALKKIIASNPQRLQTYNLTGEKWYEVDDIQDLDIAETLFAESDSKRLDLMQSRFGGYWRYPNLIDFCYLVNPFYPTEKMIDEIKNSADRLIRDYPSGMRINSLLAAKHFGVKEDYIVIGNGASELIKVIMDDLEGNIGVIVPTFEEYPNRSPHLNVIEYPAHLNGYYYNSKDLIDYYQDKDLDTLILINPDNPSGNYIHQEEVIKLSGWCKANNILLILDESFIDFVDAEESASLIENDILEDNENLVIIKSISKSHGVPGVRLGILASSNKALIKEIKSTVSIWNINSFGEFYMQIVDKYKSDFKTGMEKFYEIREDFYQDLKKITFLKTYESQSNYFMCEVIGGYTSRELTEILLVEHDVFIKDLSPKTGFEREFIRVAVKQPEENRKIIDALMKLE